MHIWAPGVVTKGSSTAQWETEVATRYQPSPLPGNSPGLMSTLSLERLMKTSRYGLWARFRNQFFHTWELDDDSVLKHLRASTKKLTRKQGDLPPPGGLQCHVPSHVTLWGSQ